MKICIDAKTVQDFVRRLVTLSMDACSKCVEKHPFVFGVVLGFFLLYFLIPSVFYFLLYTSPVVFCIIVSIKIYSTTQNCKLQQINVKRVDKKSFVESKSPLADHPVVSTSGDKTVIQSRRRNFKDKNKEWDTEDGNEEQKSGRAPLIDGLNAENQKLVMEERENVATAENIQAPEDLFNETSLNEERSKGRIEEKESSCLDRGESSSGNALAGEDAQALDQHQSILYSEPSMIDLIHNELAEQSKNIGIGSNEVEVESSSDDAEDEEETQQERNKAVEWTADDQQNLMDLGDSELERNKRLESLIARRRARKLFRTAIDKRVIDPGCSSQGQIAPISILRSTLLNGPSSESLGGPQTPGSAPSVLLPSRNPFDIPYDPLEEKPNLMSDSFQQEFSAAHQKDVFFPKHEGLCWGPSFSLETQQNQNDFKSSSYANERKPQEGLRFSRFRTFSDMSAHDQLIDNYLCQGQALFRMLSATDLVEVGSHASKQSKKAEEVKDGDREPSNGMAGIKEETYFQDVESRSPDRSEVHRDTDSVRDHSSEVCSLASDEASELSFHGNLPTHPEILEPRAGKFPQKLSDRVQNSLTFLVPENIAYNGTAYDSSPSPVDKPKVENRFFFRDKMPCLSPVYSIASDLQVEVSEIGSPPLPTDGAMSPADVESSYDGDVEREMTSGSEEMFGASSHLSGVDENESRSIEVNEVREDDIVEVGFSAIKQNLQDQTSSSTSPGHVADQNMSSTSTLSSSRNEMPEKDEAHSKNSNNKVSQNVKQVGAEVHRPPKLSDALPPKIPQKHLQPMKESMVHQPCGVYSEKPQELSNPPEKSATEVNVVCNAGDQEVHPKNEHILTKNIALTDLSQPAEKITSESSKDIENKTVSELEEGTKENKPEDVGETSKTTEARDSLLTVQDSKDEQSITDVRVSGVNQSSDNPIVHPLQPMASISEQISASSSSCSSPRSVLPGNIPKDQIPSSHVDRQANANVQQTIVDGIVRNNSGDEVEPESLPLTAPQDSQNLVVNPLQQPSTSSSSGLSEEPSVEGKSETAISPVAAILKSEDAPETDPGSIDHIERKSQIVPERKAGLSSLEPQEKIANSDFPGTILKEEETPNCSEKSTAEANNINDPAVNKKEDKLKAVEGNENEPQLKKGKLTENEVTVGPSNSTEGNENSTAITAREDIIRFTEQATSEDDVEAGNPSESKNIMEYEAYKQMITAAESALQEAPSHPAEQKPTEIVDIMHNLIEMSDKKNLIELVNVADQLEPVKAIAEGDVMYNMKETDAIDNISNKNEENFADQPKPSKATSQFDILLNANETLGNDTGSMNSLIDQELVAEQPHPVKSPAEVEVMHNMNKTLHTEMSNKKSLLDQENILDQPNLAKTTAEVGIIANVNETLVTEMINNKILINQGNVADQPTLEPIESEVNKETDTAI